MGASTIRSILGWSKAAEKLSKIYPKGMLAERLRANVYPQVDYGEGYLEGEKGAEGECRAVKATS